jgi:hypothetical protein
LRHTRVRQGANQTLQFVVAEDVVLAAARATGATYAANQKKSHAHRHNDSKEASVRHKPMNQAMHIEGHHKLTSETSLLN